MREVRIGGKLLQLNGEKSFRKKVDLRPEVDAIADIACEFDGVDWNCQMAYNVAQSG